MIYYGDLTDPGISREDPCHLNELILYSSLDLVDQIMKTTTEAYLKVVDSVNEFQVSAFVPISQIKLLLLHKPFTKQGTEESVRMFFQEVYLAYIKILLDPNYQIRDHIISNSFENTILQLSQKLLN